MRFWKLTIISILGILCILALSGCGMLSDWWYDAWTNKYTEDYTVTHKKLLDYTLGDWEVVKKENKHYQMKNENEMNEDYTSWDISYKDKDGKEQILHLENNRDMGENLIAHTEKLLKLELESIIGENEHFYIRDPYLTTNWSDSTKAYSEHPEVLYENYKEAFKFSDFSLQRPFENSPIYLYLGLKFEGNLTDEEKVAKWDAIRPKILELSPNINMLVGLQFGDSQFVNISYVNGENKDSSPTSGSGAYEKLIRGFYTNFDETALVKEE